MFSRTSGVTGETAPALSQRNKLPLCAKSWPIIQIHSLSPICSESRQTPILPAVRPQALRHQNPANHPNRKGSGGIFPGSARGSRVAFGALAKRIFPPIGRMLKESRTLRRKICGRNREETDGRWIAEIPRIPGAMAYGSSRPETVPHARTVGYGATLFANS